MLSVNIPLTRTDSHYSNRYNVCAEAGGGFMYGFNLGNINLDAGREGMAKINLSIEGVKVELEMSVEEISAHLNHLLGMKELGKKFAEESFPVIAKTTTEAIQEIAACITTEFGKFKNFEIEKIEAERLAEKECQNNWRERHSLAQE